MKLKALNVKKSWEEQFAEIDRETYTTIMKKYSNETDNNFFMDWLDSYDFSLSTDKYKKGGFEYANECLIARQYQGYGLSKYYVRKELLEEFKKEKEEKC